jgi:hypothetical protein
MSYALDRATRQRIYRAFDRSPSARIYDLDGRLRVELCPISKVCVAPYLGKEVGAPGLDPEGTYYLLRPAEELAKAAASANGIPILSRHIPMGADDHDRSVVVGSTLNDARLEGAYLVVSVVVWDGDSIAAIEDGTCRELSGGYRHEVEMTPGVYGGQRYDGIMRALVFNHIALVEVGRNGSDVAVLDAAPLWLREERWLRRFELAYCVA